MRITYATVLSATLLGIALFLLTGCTEDGRSIFRDNRYDARIPRDIERIAIALEKIAGITKKHKQKENEICE